MTQIHPIVQPQQLLHNCPLCGGQVYHKQHYPQEICPFCVQSAVNEQGQAIAILPSTYWSRNLKSDSVKMTVKPQDVIILHVM